MCLGVPAGKHHLRFHHCFDKAVRSSGIGKVRGLHFPLLARALPTGEGVLNPGRVFEALGRDRLFLLRWFWDAAGFLGRVFEAQGAPCLAAV